MAAVRNLVTAQRTIARLSRRATPEPWSAQATEEVAGSRDLTARQLWLRGHRGGRRCNFLIRMMHGSVVVRGGEGHSWESYPR